MGMNGIFILLAQTLELVEFVLFIPVALVRTVKELFYNAGGINNYVDNNDDEQL